MKQINIYGIILSEEGIVKAKENLFNCTMTENYNNLEECLITKAKKNLNIDISILGYLGKTEEREICNHFYSCKTTDKENIKYVIDYEKLFDLEITYKEYVYKAIKGKYC